MGLLGFYRCLARSELGQSDRKACPVTASSWATQTKLIEDDPSRFLEILNPIWAVIGTGLAWAFYQGGYGHTPSIVATVELEPRYILCVLGAVRGNWTLPGLYS